jgi:predicted dehydrogenase
MIGKTEDGERPMIKVGVIGIGNMGTTHLDVYGKRDDVQILAVSDLVPEKREGVGKTKGNIEGQAKGGLDFSSFRKYAEGMELIADPDVELVDICLPTPLHHPYAVAALRAGKHVLVEKPFCRTSAEADDLVAEGAKAKGMLMCALCMRFWPGWDWLKQAVEKGTYGKVFSASFRRLSCFPGRSFYLDGNQSGGAALDLHVHDVDFVQHCFGMPKAVFSRGYCKESSATDHVLTQYIYDDIPLVSAEGGWSMKPPFGFWMRYVVNFEKATAVFDIGGKPALRVMIDGKAEEPVLEAGIGYQYEIDYFLECIRTGRRPERVKPEDAANAVRLVEAEVESIRTGQVVSL